MQEKNIKNCILTINMSKFYMNEHVHDYMDKEYVNKCNYLIREEIDWESMK